MLLSPGALLAQTPDTGDSPDEQRERRKALAEQRRAQAEARREAQRAEAITHFDALANAYLSNEMEKVPELYKRVRPKMRALSRGQQQAVKHMATKAPTYRPKWWKGTKRQEKNSFNAEIWGRTFSANYVPTKELGLQAVFPKREFNRKTGRYEIVDLIILVTWKPLMVDSPDPAKGRLAQEHNYTLGDIAEIIVWHELGHNYITEMLPTKANIELYEKYDRLYSTMHEYFADMSAIYHCTPRARRIVLQFRLDDLDYYTPDQEHCRGAAHGIGAIVLADMLMNPDAWPSVRFPPKVPSKQVEINTIIYVYENLSPNWTIHEDIRLQTLAHEYIMKQGERTFKTKGTIDLPNKLQYKMMFGEDRENQKKRDAWVSDKLKEFISSGRADKIDDVGEYNPPHRTHTRREPESLKQELDKLRSEAEGKAEKEAPKRIEIPWDHH